jgi:hypothetical protein
MEETVNMKTLATTAALAAAAFVAAACDSTGAGKNGNGASAVNELHDDVPTDVVRVDRRDVAPDGRVTYVLENVSGKLQEDLTYFVEFHYASTGKGAINIADEVEVSPERELVLLKSDLAKQITVDNPKPGQKVLGAKLFVRSTPPVAAVARDASGPGTYFLNHAIECVGMASPDELRAGSLWIEVENVSDRPVSELEAKAVFVDQMTKEKGGETKWTVVRDLPKRGARARVQFDLGGLGKVDNLSFLVKIRQQSM